MNPRMTATEAMAITKIKYKETIDYLSGVDTVQVSMQDGGETMKIDLTTKENENGN